MAFRVMLLVIFSVIAGVHCENRAFLQSGETLSALFREEVHASFGNGGLRTAELEDALHPIFVSLPKNQYGNLGQAGVAYALHRIFSHRHGWYFHGLAPAGGNWQEVSPTSVFKDRLPQYLQNLFENQLGARGLGLHELAILASAFERLVRTDEVGRLELVYSVHGRQLSDTIEDEKELGEMLDTYMVSLLMGINMTDMSKKRREKALGWTSQNYPGWSDTQIFVRDLTRSMEYAERHERNPFVKRSYDFPRVVDIVEETGHTFGKFQDYECREVKDALLELEEGDSGRVRLSNFYKANMDGVFPFQESREYLQELGALDATSSFSEPRVLVANYMSSLSNCIGSASFYAICCLNECENLQLALEREIQAPNAEPHRILSIVVGLSTSTVEAPRNLSTALISRLDDIAMGHGGEVPLHGRLFAQWMHHAFPRECPYPHLAGTTAPKKVDHAKVESHMAASAEEMLMYADLTNSSNDTVEEVQWSAEEELLEHHPSWRRAVRSRFSFSVWEAVRPPMQLAALVSFAVMLVRSASAGSKAITDDTDKASKFV